MKRVYLGLAVLITALLPTAYSVRAQRTTGPVRLETRSLADIRQLDGVVDRMSRDGELRLRMTLPDTILDDRAHERFDQYYKGVRVYSADLTRQTDRGLTVSVFGALFDDVTVETTATVSVDEARAIVARLADAPLPPTDDPELVILPRDGGGFVLTYQGRVFGSRGPVVYFIDARTGDVNRVGIALEHLVGCLFDQGRGLHFDCGRISWMF